jgi:hypothetical protein
MPRKLWTPIPTVTEGLGKILGNIELQIGQYCCIDLEFCTRTRQAGAERFDFRCKNSPND